MDGDADDNDPVYISIISTVSHIGYHDGEQYVKDEDCLECLKDFIRFLRNDDSTCKVRRYMGDAKIIESEVIPIMTSCNEKEHDILEMCIRLLVNMTQPAVLCFGGKVPTGKIERKYYLQVTAMLQSCKQAFAKKKIMEVLAAELARLLQLEWEHRTDNDAILIERILLSLRNILHVPADPDAEKRTDEDATIHDQVLWNLHVNGVDSLILYIASSPDESRWCMHDLEIIFHMLREQKADMLAKTAVQKSKKEEDEETRELDILFERERVRKKGVSLKGLRHSNFGGTFTIQNMKALNDDNKLLYHRPLQNAKTMSFDVGKDPRKKRKREIHAKEDTERRSTLSVRMFLKEFCCEFLENAYNPFMRTVKDIIKHQRAQQHDESYFLWAMRFFMEFNRKNNSGIAYISETLNVPTFQYILTLQTTFYDNMTIDKMEKLEWARRLHLALRAYQEIIQHLAAMEKDEDTVIRDSANVIKENVFYIPEYRDIFLNLLRTFNPSIQTRSFLSDVIEAFHLFVKVLESHCNTKGRMIVQQKKRKPKRKKKVNRSRQKAAPPLTGEQLEERWQELSAGLSAVLQSEENTIADITNPFNPVSEFTEDEQRVHCLSNIRKLLREASFSEALALLRAAREFWPNSTFGENEADPEDEFMCFYEIFRMELPNNEEPEEVVGEEDELSDPEEEEMEAVQVSEREFDISDFLKKLANPKILQPYCWLLDWYQENSLQVNHYIVKMLHRVAVDLKMPAMLFQLSLFITFRKILQDPASKKLKELVTFCKYILSKFFNLLPSNPVLCAETLFWKSSNESYEITEGYGTIRQRNVGRSNHNWTFEEEEELKSLYEEFKDSDDLVENILSGITNEFRSRRQVVNKLITLRLVEDKELLKKKPVKNVWREDEENELERLFDEHRNSDDIVGSILPNLSNQSRTRRQVSDKLISLGLVDNKDELKKKPSKKSAWREEEENELRVLFEQFKNSVDIVDDIVANLSNQSRTRRQVINQLVKLHIVEDRNTLRKKRATKSEKKKENFEEGFQSEEGESDMDDNIDEQETDESSDEDNAQNSPSLVEMLRHSAHGEQLEWIKTRLTNAADDREDGDYEPLPLVTITEESALALRDRDFQKVLKKIGLVPPANEQESYWRIPGHLTPAELRKSVGDIETALEILKTEVSKENNPKRQKLAALAASMKSANKREDRAKKRNKRGGEKRHSVLSDSGRHSEEDNKDISSTFAEASSSKKQKRKRIRMDSEDSDEHEEQERDLNEANDHNPDHQDTNGAVENSDDYVNEFDGGRREEENVETLVTKETGSNGEGTDDEDTFDAPVARNKRRRVVLDDDDE